MGTIQTHGAYNIQVSVQNFSFSMNLTLDFCLIVRKPFLYNVY